MRVPFFIAAGVVLLVVIGLEAGSSLVGGSFNPAVMRLQATRQLEGGDIDADDRAAMIDEAVSRGAASDKPPGLALPAAAVLDGLVLYAMLLMAASLVIRESVHGKLQGIVTLVVAILCLIAAVVMTMKALVLLMIMVALLLATPFGTLAYLAVWGFFDRGTASALLGLAMTLKVAFVALLALAHQSFLAIKRQMLMVATTIAATFVITLLHGFVPGVLVSIADALAAIIVGILVIIWCIALLVGSVVSIIKAV